VLRGVFSNTWIEEEQFSFLYTWVSAAYLNGAVIKKWYKTKSDDDDVWM